MVIDDIPAGGAERAGLLADMAKVRTCSTPSLFAGVERDMC